MLTQGPCEEGEWFVLDRYPNARNSNLPKAICKKRNCESIPNPNNARATTPQESVMLNGKCVIITSSEGCSIQNMIVLVNPLGEGNTAFIVNVYILLRIMYKDIDILVFEI